VFALAVPPSVMLGACSRKDGPSADLAPAPPASPVASTAPPPPPVTPSSAPPSPPAASSAAPDAAVQARLVAFFKQYKDGTDFEFLRTACVSPIDLFVTAKNADIGTVIASARQFFKGKHFLAYTPDVQQLRVDHDGALTVARLPLKMMWGVAPREVMTEIDWPEDTDAGLDPNEFDPLWARLVEHQVTVDVELAFDAAGRITRYVEGPPHKNRLRATGEESCSEKRFDPGVGVKALAKGAIVTDLGDSYMTNLSIKGPDIIRRVRLPGGGNAWVNDRLSWEVPNPSGGTSAGGAQCLEAAD